MVSLRSSTWILIVAGCAAFVAGVVILFTTDILEPGVDMESSISVPPAKPSTQARPPKPGEPPIPPSKTSPPSGRPGGAGTAPGGEEEAGTSSGSSSSRRPGASRGDLRKSAGEFFLAVERGMVSRIAKMLEAGFDVNGLDDKGRTPLYVAAAGEQEEVVALLLSRGANVNRGNTSKGSGDSGWSPLHVAAMKGNKQIIEMLLDKGADVHATVQDWWSPLALAILHDHTDSEDALREGGATIPQNRIADLDLLQACEKGDSEAAIESLSRSADPNVLDQWGDQVLIKAIGNNDLDFVKLLVSQGANVNCLNSCGASALLVAVDDERAEIVEVLLAHGANPNGMGKYAFREGKPIHLAVEKGNLVIVEHLLEKGVDVNLKTPDSRNTPLHIAAWRGQVPMVEFLLEKGGALHAKNSRGYTPLDLATQYGRTEVANLLKKRAGK